MNQLPVMVVCVALSISTKILALATVDDRITALSSGYKPQFNLDSKMAPHLRFVTLISGLLTNSASSMYCQLFLAGPVVDVHSLLQLATVWLKFAARLQGELKSVAFFGQQ